ncbi:uncharacterized protein LOC107176326 [Citrus sinensis]|uniref:uncharacterized protein LOC107176326 n=1 Tax=Citrus sinensis TaxID=2711 RepID=UPI0007635EF2|nr:uncharacterized protein LOC107176326 [Citrus sinensis]XP_024039323.1 proteoglycan 4-like [Citrus x clementina]
MKRTHRNFPDALLQQFNFYTNTTGALAAASKKAIASDEPGKVAATEPQAAVDSEEAKPFDPPEDEGDKSETDSSPSEAEDNSEKEILASKGKDKDQAKIATPPDSTDKLEQVDVELAAAVAARAMPTPEQAKQLLAVITVEGQATEALTTKPPQQTPSQPIRTSPRKSSKRKGSTSTDTATATPAPTPLASPTAKNTKMASCFPESFTKG